MFVYNHAKLYTDTLTPQLATVLVDLNISNRKSSMNYFKLGHLTNTSVVS